MLAVCVCVFTKSRIGPVCDVTVTVFTRRTDDHRRLKREREKTGLRRISTAIRKRWARRWGFGGENKRVSASVRENLLIERRTRKNVNDYANNMAVWRTVR